MRFKSVLMLLFSITSVAAQSPNSFNLPKSGDSTVAGSPVALQWNPTTSGTISLYLLSGPSNNLVLDGTIAQSIANSGSFTWNIPSSTPRGNYVIEIIADSDYTQVNFTPQFSIASAVASAATTSTTTPSTIATTSSPSASTTSTPTGSVATSAAVTTTSQALSTQLATTTSTSPAASSSAPNAINSDNTNNGPNVGAIAGGVVGGVLGLALIAGVVFYLIRRKRRQKAPVLAEMQRYAVEPKA